MHGTVEVIFPSTSWMLQYLLLGVFLWLSQHETWIFCWAILLYKHETAAGLFEQLDFLKSMEFHSLQSASSIHVTASFKCTLSGILVLVACKHDLHSCSLLAEFHLNVSARSQQQQNIYEISGSDTRKMYLDALKSCYFQESCTYKL